MPWARQMRKMMIRASAKDEFADFAAMHASRLLAVTRNRNGKSPREIRTGRRQKLSKFKFHVWGCRAVARKPIPWRDNKIDAQAIDGVYLGSARGKPGYWVWSAEYGLMTSSDVTFFETEFRRQGLMGGGG